MEKIFMIAQLLRKVIGYLTSRYDLMEPRKKIKTVKLNSGVELVK